MFHLNNVCANSKTALAHEVLVFGLCLQIVFTIK